MSAYRTIVVGTDGSSTSLAAVDRAAAVAKDADAELLIVCAYTPASRESTLEAEDALKEEAFLVRGWTPAEETLRVAEEPDDEVMFTDRDLEAVELMSRLIDAGVLTPDVCHAVARAVAQSMSRL